MEKALKIGRLVAYIAETIMATFVVADTIRNFSDNEASGKSKDKVKPAA